MTAMSDPLEALRHCGAQLFVRGWLSANQILFAGNAEEPAVVVDTGYFSHAEQTVRLIEHALAGRSLGRIVNTHLHSDHCGGNRELQARFPGVGTEVPAGFQAAVAPWTEAKLSFKDTGQHCPPFRVDTFFHPGQELKLGPRLWQVHAAPGHDPDALMFFEPATRMLISGDALWEQRLAIIFPELTGAAGFHSAHQALDTIERLDPALVLPGHGEMFTDVQAAIRQSRARIDSFAARPERHRRHAARALAVFHMLEHKAVDRLALERWIAETPIFARTLGPDESSLLDEEALKQTLKERAMEVVDSLLDDHILAAQGGNVVLAASAESA